jgi:hypothetical protein
VAAKEALQGTVLLNTRWRAGTVFSGFRFVPHPRVAGLSNDHTRVFRTNPSLLLSRRHAETTLYAIADRGPEPHPHIGSFTSH